ncbi:hypothetical protein HWC80_gp011 [Mycobacterium phage Indlulamithi]|uniref:Minor capsid protein n=1 Tax=Mycobacterium phage Indlulamithi TaxID=2656582 RepID=A0A649VDM3_9CAUD|nr:hypothetical protein HWC80_gp011 [Mycobacterium phage Indlulamithi]QGJ90052.1 minor capsid protein [Mycobacterium phage Indlulamithi]
MSRYDKINPKNGSYRASLAADLPPALVEHTVAVGHDANGRLVVGAGQTGVKAILILTKAYKAGYRCDPMVSGEVVEFGPNDGTAEAGVDFAEPGTNYFGHADGTVTATKGADGVYVGHTVDNGQRLIVRVRGDEREVA